MNSKYWYPASMYEDYPEYDDDIINKDANPEEPKCSCEIRDLMISGCKCGRLKWEQDQKKS